MMPQIRNSRSSDIGELNQKIAIEKQIFISDGGVGNTPDWVPFRTVWAKYDNPGGHSLNQAAGKEDYFDKVRFTISFDKEIAKKPTDIMRIVYAPPGESKSVYEITGINRLGGSRYFLEISCNGNEIEEA